MKRARQNEKRRDHNRVYLSSARTYVKRARRLIDNGELEDAQVAVENAVKALDRAAQQGIIHKNNAARRKSRLVRSLNEAQKAV
jgi:small subunit ribosomal protein S20